MNEFQINTKLDRIDQYGDVIECDILITFIVDSSSGLYLLEVTEVEFDGPEPDDAPGALTPCETEMMIVWFFDNYDRALAIVRDELVCG